MSSLKLNSDRLTPIFRDRDELAAASDLTDTIETALRESSAIALAGRYDEARETASRAVALAEKLAVSALELAAAYFSSATVEGFAEENQAGQEHVLRALELQRSAGAAGTLLAESLNLAGTMALETNRLDEAEQYLSEAVAIARQEFGEYHLLTAVYMENLVNVWYRTNRLPDSLEGLKKILEIRTKVLGPEHEMVGRTLANLETLYRISGILDLASSYLQQSLEVFEALPEQHPLIAQLLSMVPANEMASGKLTQAISRLQRSMAIRTEVFGADQRQTSQISEQLGRAHALAGQP